MRIDNYVYFVTSNGNSRDNGSKSLEKRGILLKFKKLQKVTAKEIKKGNYYHFDLLIEGEIQDNLSGTLNNIKLSIYSLHESSQKVNLRSISISKTLKINHTAWEEIKLIFDLVFANSLTKIIICNGITQYPTKAQRSQLMTQHIYSDTERNTPNTWYECGGPLNRGIAPNAHAAVTLNFPRNPLAVTSQPHARNRHPHIPE